MYEVKSMGTTIEITQDTALAYDVYNRAVGGEVTLWKYNQDGNKQLVGKRFSFIKMHHSKSRVV